MFFTESVWFTRTVCSAFEFQIKDNFLVCRIYFIATFFKEDQHTTFHTIFCVLHYSFETFPFAWFASNYLPQTLISLTSLFWYAKICCNFPSLIFTTEKSNQYLVFDTEMYTCSEVLYVWFTAAQSVWGRGQEELLFLPLWLSQWTTEKASFSQTCFTSHIDKQVKEKPAWDLGIYIGK